MYWSGACPLGKGCAMRRATSTELHDARARVGGDDLPSEPIPNNHSARGGWYHLGASTQNEYSLPEAQDYRYPGALGAPTIGCNAF